MYKCEKPKTSGYCCDIAVKLFRHPAISHLHVINATGEGVDEKGEYFGISLSKSEVIVRENTVTIGCGCVYSPDKTFDIATSKDDACLASYLSLIDADQQTLQ